MSFTNLPPGFVWRRSGSPFGSESMDLVSRTGVRIARMKPFATGWIVIIEDRCALGLGRSFSSGSPQKCAHWLHKWIAMHRDQIPASVEAVPEEERSDAHVELGLTFGATLGISTVAN